MPPAHGTLAGAGTQWTYTPHEDYTGADSAGFEVDDGALSAQAQVAITILDIDIRRVHIPLAAR